MPGTSRKAISQAGSPADGATDDPDAESTLTIWRGWSAPAEVKAVQVESFERAHHTDWNLTMAATVLVMAPVLLVFFFAQKAFVEGITLTGVKG